MVMVLCAEASENARRGERRGEEERRGGDAIPDVGAGCWCWS
jgi:hypothetical protein